jgi:hypothetical protein
VQYFFKVAAVNIAGVGTQSMPGNPGAAIRSFARGTVVSPPF